MFKNLKSLFGSKASAKGTTPATASPEPVVATAAARTPVATPVPVPAKAPVVKVPEKSPEELCGITPKMPKEEVRQKLALLYRRYNRATSSLDGPLRAEADRMLDAIVTIREKVFGPI